MAGASDSVNIREVDAWIGNLNGQLRSLRIPLKQCASLIAGATKGNFQSQSTPGGTGWPPLKKPRKRPKGAKPGTDKILLDRGLLAASVSASGGGAGHVEVLTDSSLIYGSNLEYAATHNYGDPSRNIPMRKFLGLTPAIIVKFRDIFQRFVSSQVGKGK